MGTICILLGLIIFIIFTVAGIIASNWAVGNITVMSLLSIKTPTQAYIMIVGLCAAIGLLICLNLVMHGLTYNKVSKMAASVKKITRKAAK